MYKLKKGNRTTKAKSEWFRDILIKKGWQEYGGEEATETHAERQAVETEQEKEEVTHVGAGWYELPNGERVRGKENAIEALKG